MKGKRFYFFIAMLFGKKFSVIGLLLTNQNGAVKNLVFNSVGTQLLGFCRNSPLMFLIFLN